MADDLVRSLNLDVVDALELLPRSESRLSLPSGLLCKQVSAVLKNKISGGTLWNHQVVSLEMLLEGDNVVIATGTASGKSLIFQLLALQRIFEDRQSKILVFYPLKALASDQFERWQNLVRSAGLDSSTIARIDGDMLTPERFEAIERSSVVLMTPDVCQAWLMRNVGHPQIRHFLKRLVLLVLDEAHVYESVFGSNVAFLIRRLISVKRLVAASSSLGNRLQIVAATATIRDAAEHLHKLTGLPFKAVDERQNGAPLYKRKLIHVDAPDYGSSGEKVLTQIARAVLRLPTRHRFIAFLDSRQGVERVVRQLNERTVLPYRSGYEASDRKNIERALRDGRLNGVIATSALELGIDVADIEVGINLGVPESRKAFRQRIGRIGRTGPGVFFLVAPSNAFRRFGETIKEYYEGSIEPSYLYLGNRFIQFAHARCLLEELELIGAKNIAPPAGLDWPEGFADVFRMAKPNAGREREFDLIAQLGADAPHLNYPLRQVGEANFDIKEGRGDWQRQIGNIATHQAIREAYPGATYLHMGRAYKVQEWRTWGFERAIVVTPAARPVPTRPILRKCVNLSLAPDGIVGDRIKRQRTGLVAEVYLHVNESVEGYLIGNKSYYYKTLRTENPNMSRKQRDFRTTGVIIRIDEPWFSGSQVATARRAVAEGLLEMISRERSISPRDIDATHTNIALITESGPRRLTDAVVIYDSVYGGLRLTEDLFDAFDKYVTQLNKAAGLAGGDAIVDREITNTLLEWTKKLESGRPDSAFAGAAPEGWLQIYKPGSIVSILYNGIFVEREIQEPIFEDFLNSGVKQLWYRYKTPTGVALVPHEQVRATGQDWSWVYWNPETGEFQELE